MSKESYHFWSELLKYNYLKKSIKDLADKKFGINLAVRPALYEKVGEIVKECNEYDVDLVFWPLLSFKQGYWVNSWNFKLQIQWIQKLMDKYSSVDKYTLDLESPINFESDLSTPSTPKSKTLSRAFFSSELILL